MYSGNDNPCGLGFPIRKSTDQSLLTAPRGLSQRATSFIASARQGIHQMPLRRLITLIITAHSRSSEEDGNVDDNEKTNNHSIYPTENFS